MAQSKTTKSDEFDSIVIGGSLAGLIAAHQLEASGRKVALVDGLDTLGGSCRPVPSKAGMIDYGLKIFPATEESQEALAWLSDILEEEITYEIIEAPAVNYDEGKFKPFIGFGDQKIQTASEIAAYAQGKYLRLSTTPKDWIPRLSSTFIGKVMTQSYVTKMQVDDEFVIELLINGSKRLSGREILFAATPQQLTRLLPESHAPGKLRAKLLKGEFFTSVNTDLIHKGVVTESEAVHVLKGANEEPSVGIFERPTRLEDGSLVQVSQWMTLVPRDITDEPELVASALKQIKRQVKRAYEHSVDNLVQERIVVNPTSHGDLVGSFPPDGRWPKLQNLWVLSGMMDEQKNLLGAIRQTRRTLAVTAGEPVMPIDHETDLAEGPTATA